MGSKINDYYYGLLSIGNILPKILSKICDEDFKNIFEFCDNCTNDGLCATYLCFNAHTKELHQDKGDSSYTIIGVPCVPEELEKESGDYAFEFAIGGKKERSIKIKLEQGLILYYAGYALHHRQIVTRTGNFINVACYHNKRFFCNIKESLKRIGFLKIFLCY